MLPASRRGLPNVKHIKKKYGFPKTCVANTKEFSFSCCLVLGTLRAKAWARHQRSRFNGEQGLSFSQNTTKMIYGK